MFKVLILQTMHALSDERTEFLIKDRLSFMRFLGLGLADNVPDANTIWSFREALKKAGAIDVLFKRFDEALRREGFLAMSGQIVDGFSLSFDLDLSRVSGVSLLLCLSLLCLSSNLERQQRNTIEEKAAIKEGRVPDDWKDKPAKLAQKDRDARWTVKCTRIANAQKSKVRSRVEHIFAHQKDPMGLVVRTTGLARARVKIGLADLACNMCRWLRMKYAAA